LIFKKLNNQQHLLLKNGITKGKMIFIKLLIAFSPKALNIVSNGRSSDLSRF